MKDTANRRMIGRLCVPTGSDAERDSTSSPTHALATFAYFGLDIGADESSISAPYGYPRDSAAARSASRP